MKIFGVLILIILGCGLLGCNYNGQNETPLFLQPARPTPPEVLSEPPPVTEPLVATFDSIDKNVFQKYCTSCHSPNGAGKRVLLDLQSLLESPLELIIPGNPDESIPGDPDESGLVIAIERTDNKRMPPEKSGYSALSDETKIIIRKWIENGAKD